MKYAFTITARMISDPAILGNDRELLEDAIGAIQWRDVGKQVYDCGGFFQVENDEQRARRTA